MDKIASAWQDYECLYAGAGQKIERWKDIILQRPDPLALWSLPEHNLTIDATYQRSKSGGGSWQYHNKLPSSWNISYGQLQFKVSTLGFKHTGIFPEQAANWDDLQTLIQMANRKEFRVLNLFAYTGAATLACARCATEVVHVDASKGMVLWAKENAHLSGMENNRIRFIVDDCLKFMQREQRRGRSYQGIIMDPPSYGRGPNNEIWKFDQQIVNLINEAAKLLAADAVFFLVNSYASGYSATVLENLLCSNLRIKNLLPTIVTGELLIPVHRQNIYLPGGIYGMANKS